MAWTRAAREGFAEAGGGRWVTVTGNGTLVYEEAPVRIELTNSRFAVCRLTTWPRRRDDKVIGFRGSRAIGQRQCRAQARPRVSE